MTSPVLPFFFHRTPHPTSLDNRSWSTGVTPSVYDGVARPGAIARAGSGPSFVSAVIEECTRVATAAGYPPAPDMADLIRGMFSQTESTYGPSMLIDIEDGRPTEGEHTIGDMAGYAAVSVPILSAALCNLQVYEINRNDPR